MQESIRDFDAQLPCSGRRSLNETSGLMSRALAQTRTEYLLIVLNYNESLQIQSRARDFSKALTPGHAEMRCVSG